MTIFAVTGHMDLTEETVPLITEALSALFSDSAGNHLTGISCIAQGADTLFAEAVLRAKGRLIVIVPSRDYREAKVTPDHAAVFDRLAAAADEVVVMEHEKADRAAYESANAELLRRAECLVAIWDGSPPSGNGGGTADTVLLSREANIPVHVIWPEGARRRNQTSA